MKMLTWFFMEAILLQTLLCMVSKLLKADNDPDIDHRDNVPHKFAQSSLMQSTADGLGAEEGSPVMRTKETARLTALAGGEVAALSPGPGQTGSRL